MIKNESNNIEQNNMENEKVDVFDILNDSNNEEFKNSYTTISFTYINKDNKLWQINLKEKITSFAIFVNFIKYVATSSMIFAILVLTANYSAYIDVAKSYIYADELKIEASSLVNSVEASNITSKEETKIEKQIKREEQILNKEKIKKMNKKYSDEIKNSTKSKYSIKKFVNETNNKKPSLDIEITPYENRIIIPKISKNIPLLDIKQKSVDSTKELDDIFMKELENWVVRYPGSTTPGKKWNTFIFGHSSNYPWIKWDYNDVFAKLWKVNFWDEIIVYYWQEKYTYKIKEKKVIKPWDVKVLKRDNNKDEITLMTCWPVGTTINRLIVIWEIVK